MCVFAIVHELFERSSSGSRHVKYMIIAKAFRGLSLWALKSNIQRSPYRYIPTHTLTRLLLARRYRINKVCEGAARRCQLQGSYSSYQKCERKINL